MSKNTEKSKKVSSYSTPTLDIQTVPIAAKILTHSPSVLPIAHSAASQLIATMESTQLPHHVNSHMNA